MPGYETINNKELDNLKKIFINGNGVLCRGGYDKLRGKSFQVEEFEKKFAKKFYAKYSLAVSSGTAALRVALSTLNLKKDDEVITQSFTFVATVEAIIEARARPIFTEIDDTLNMDPNDLIKKISKKTRAVIAVHMLGVPASLDLIKKICNKHKLILIEDTAWGCGGQFQNKYLGTHGDIGAFSFDFAKTITTGEGGMLLFKSKKKFQAAAAWHDHGHENNPNLPRWEDSRKDSGFNFRMTEMQGAVGLAQLKKLNNIIKTQRKNHNLIWRKLKKIKEIKLRKYPLGSKISADAIVVLVKNSNYAKLCREELLKNHISTKILPEAYTWHFCKEWKHIKNLNIKKNDFLISKKILSKAVSIPILYKMKKNFPSLVFKSFKKALRNRI